jgi:methionyl aminopeptidase
VDQMAASGEILVRCLKMLAAKARPGITTEELDAAAEKFIRSQGAEPAFKGYRGFPGSICASPNSMVVHGIPDAYELKRGDVISIDVGVIKDGWVSDRSAPRHRSCSTSPRRPCSRGWSRCVPTTTSATSPPRFSAR